MTREEIKKAIATEVARAEPNWQIVENASRALVESDPDSVRFTVDAGHIQRLGAELVGNQNTALSELIKNAYDSDATVVSLTFENQGMPGGLLTIADDGSGMDDDVIRSSWMRISTPSKVEQPQSPLFGRVRAGRKGIGRFSVQRLGKHLNFETRPRDREVGFRVTFNWDQSFRAGRDLSEVFSRIERFDKRRDECGTTLRITDLRDAWTEATISKVWRSVLLLQPPFPVEKKQRRIQEGRVADPGFSVSINGQTRDQQRVKYSIESTFLTQAIARIAASIDEKGTASVTVLAPKVDLSDSQQFSEKFLITGALHFSAHYFIYLSSTLSGMSQAVAGEMGRTFGGIRVYRNGFRVLPYGEPTDDWLEIDADVSRRELLVPANNRNFFGQVELSTAENPLFEETSSREGLLENEAYIELKRFVRQSVEWAAKRVASARNRKQDAGQRNFTAEPKRPSEFLRGVRENLREAITSNIGVIDTHKVLAEAEVIASQFEEKVDKDREAALEYEEMLRLLASLGLSISVFGHEIKGAKDAMTARIALLKDAIERTPETTLKSLLEKQHIELTKAADRLFDIGGYIAGVMSSTESRQLRTLSVKGALTRFAEQFSEYMHKQGVIFEVIVEPSELRTTLMHASELDSVLLNFLTNSIKSMRTSRVHDRRVRLDASADGSYVVIGFEDTGGGVPVEIQSRVFDAFYTTTMTADEDGVVGPGTGLGLKIVADIARSYGGFAGIAEPTAGYNCRFEFRILAAEERT